MAALGLITFFDDLAFFVAGAWLLVYLPGRWWAAKLRLAGLDSFLASFLLGLVQFTLFQFWFGLLGMRWLAYGSSFGLALWSLRVHGLKKTWPTKTWRLSKLTWGILILGVVGQSSLVWRSGVMRPDGGIIFYEYRDALWHLALIEELAERMPPLHPGFAGVKLSHYHFFTDLFFGSLLAVLPLDRLDYLFRVIPMFLSSLFGLVLVSLARNLIKGSENLLLALIYFTGSSAWVLPLVFTGMPWGDSSFWVSQTFAMLLNPPLSLSLSLVGFLSVLLVALNHHWRWPVELAVVLIAGAMVGFKIYGAIVVAAGLLGYGFGQLMKGERRVVRLALVSGLLSFGVFLATNDLAGSGRFLIWAPGWFLRAMVEHPDRVYRPGMVLAEDYLRAFGGHLGIVRLRTLELFGFLTGNFGIRIIGFLGLLIVWRRWPRPLFAFWLGVLLAGVGFPLIFIQRGSVANTIQTFYYALVAAGLLTTTVLANLGQRVGVRWRLAMIVILLLVACPTNLKLVRESLRVKPQFVSAAEVAGYRLLEKLPREKTLILVAPSSRNLDAIWVGALANKRLVYADRLMAENTHQPFGERENEVKRFFQDQDPVWRREFLSRRGVTHIVLTKQESDQFSANALPVDQLFSNAQMVIYEVKGVE